MDLKRVWDEYSIGIKAFLHSKVSNPDDVDDLVQEILLKSHTNLHLLKASSSIKSWLFQIANHAIIDHYRFKGKSANLAAEDLWYLQDTPDVQESLAHCVEPFINALPDDSARLLTSIELEGLSQKEYASSHEISYSTLKSRVQKSRDQLRKIFEDCCHLSFDQKGNLMAFDAKSGSCDNCPPK